MVDPETKARFEIPLEMVEEAKRDGLVDAVDMVSAEGERHTLPASQQRKGEQAGLGFENLSPVPSPSTPEEIAEHERKRAAANEITPGNVPSQLADLWAKMNQGGPADWRNILNAIGPIAASFNRPVEAMRWGSGMALAKGKGARSLAALAPSTAPPIGEIRHVGSIPAYIPPLAKGVSEAVDTGKQAAVAAALLGRQGAQAVGNHPLKSAIGSVISATAANHFLGDPLRLKERLRAFMSQQ